MKPKSSLIISLVMSAATAIVIAYSKIHSDESSLILSVFTTTVIILWIIFATANYIFSLSHTSINTNEISEIIEDLNTEIVLWTNDCSAVFLNKKLRELLGITTSDFNNEEIIKKIFCLDEINPKSINSAIMDNYGECHFCGADGTQQCIIWSTSILKQNKKFSLYFSTGFNITQLKQVQSRLSDTSERFNLSMELSEIGILISQGSQKYFASPEMMRMLGLKKPEISFNEFRCLIHPNDRSNYDRHIKLLLSDTALSAEISCIEIRVKSHDGTYRWYSYRFKAIEDVNSDFPVIGGAFLDITMEREKDLLIEKLAYVDEITDIPNRNKLVKIGQETYECCNALNYAYWVIVIDIDRFHIVNDTCGYESGNKLLKNFAHNLYKYISIGGLAARISGDNFAIIIRDYGDDDLPQRTIELLQKDFADLAVDEFSNQSFTCSAGYSKMPSDGNCFLDVLEHAEFALKSGIDSRCSICAYESSMHDAIIGDNELEKALSDAIDNNELKLFYQPKIEIATGKFMGVEALVRWIKPDGTIIAPSYFVPIAESSHLIGKISDFVLNEACDQNMLWQRMGYPPIIMSINFTSDDFYKKDLKERVFDALVRSGLNPEWLEVELTERMALRDVDYAVFQMNQLRDLGVKLAMDDFGTGYSSLSYIQILPITLLKLDRSFIIDIENDPIAYEIVSAVIKIAKSKKIETIAEGIESPRQATILRETGCDYAQGYLYGKPMPADEIPAFFEHNASERQVF
ncbi:MAG: EAL domain-containing protein [Ruminococcus sp.]|jgi:diguanylate cyclase (GGDEF)-like protein/PAS domain S-box-containing protein|nr:EAL domain-containing protein [Ruminococcus sp.]